MSLPDSLPLTWHLRGVKENYLPGAMFEAGRAPQLIPVSLILAKSAVVLFVFVSGGVAFLPMQVNGSTKIPIASKKRSNYCSDTTQSFSCLQTPKATGGFRILQPARAREHSLPEFLDLSVSFWGWTMKLQKLGSFLPSQEVRPGGFLVKGPLRRQAQNRQSQFGFKHRTNWPKTNMGHVEVPLSGTTRVFEEKSRPC